VADAKIVRGAQFREPLLARSQRAGDTVKGRAGSIDREGEREGRRGEKWARIFGRAPSPPPVGDESSVGYEPRGALSERPLGGSRQPKAQGRRRESRAGWEDEWRSDQSGRRVS